MNPVSNKYAAKSITSKYCSRRRNPRGARSLGCVPDRARHLTERQRAWSNQAHCLFAEALYGTAN
jgi:hypothetical protein